MDKAQWKVVPVDPTPEMMQAADDRVGMHQHEESRAAYAAMLAAAPQPPSASGERDVLKALDRLDALLDPKCGLLTVSDSSGTVQASRYDLALIRSALAPSPGIDAAEPIREPLSKYQRMHAVSLYCSLPHCMDSADTVIRNIAAAAYMNGFHSGMHCAAPPAAQPSADDKNFPFYELRFIMRVLSHQGSAPKEDWQTAYGMARKVFEQWSKDSKAAEGWLAEAERLVDFYAESFSKPTDSGKCRQRLAALLAHLKARP